jgi:hypothetical protein
MQRIANDSAREFARRLENADRVQKAQLVGSYAAWVKAGTKAQGPWGLLCGVAVGAAGACLFWLIGDRSPLIVVLGAVALAGAVYAFLMAGKREAEWRRANPWRPPENLG